MLPATSLAFLAACIKALSDSRMAVLSSCDMSNSLAKAENRFLSLGVDAATERRLPPLLCLLTVRIIDLPESICLSEQ